MRHLSKLWSWITTWVSVGRIRTHVDRLDRKIDGLIKNKHDWTIDVKDRLSTLERLRAQFENESRLAIQEIEDGRLLCSKLERALEATQESLKIANEITIPGLVAANRTFIDRWDAETAVHAVRIAAVRGRENEG